MQFKIAILLLRWLLNYFLYNWKRKYTKFSKSYSNSISKNFVSMTALPHNMLRLKKKKAWDEKQLLTLKGE